MKTTNTFKLTAIAAIIASTQLVSGCAHHSPKNTGNDIIVDEKIVINIDIQTKYDEFKDQT
ncbi:MAG: hypothetical protein WC707_07170, partial [Candidatus Babeliaceae bacterium]